MEKASDISRAHKVAEEVDKKKILEGNKTSEAILKRVWAVGDEEDKDKSTSASGFSSSSSSTSQFKKVMGEYFSEKKEEKKEEKSTYSYGSWRTSSSTEKKKEDPKRKLLAQKISIDIKAAKASVLVSPLREEEFFNVVGERDMWINRNHRMRIEDYPEAQKRILRENNHLIDAIREISKIQSKAVVNVYKIGNQKTLKDRRENDKK